MKDYNIIVGGNIRAIRTYKHMSQHTLAVKCGHNTPSARAWISKIESGQRATYTSDIGIIADALGVEPPALFVDYQTTDPDIVYDKMMAYTKALTEQLQHNPNEE